MLDGFKIAVMIADKCSRCRQNCGYRPQNLLYCCNNCGYAIKNNDYKVQNFGKTYYGNRVSSCYS